MDKTILEKWLVSGHIEEGSFYETKEGTPQGGVISPRLATITLNGLEKLVKANFKRKSDSVKVIIYADDFVITSSSKELLENKVKPLVEAFLKERGLELSQEKTKITHIDDGFDFLGFNVRKYNGTLLIKPSKESIGSFLEDVRKTIKSNYTATTEGLIYLLNPKIRGWANYFRHVVAKKSFANIDYQVFCSLAKWVKRRHSRKSALWLREKYFRSHGTRNWIFSTKVRDRNNNTKYLDLFQASSVKIIRHVKIIGDANPFDPEYTDYFRKRYLGMIKR